MPRTSGSIPSFINGISQQVPSSRLPTQVEDAVNFYPTVLTGLRRRPRTTLIAGLGAVAANAKWHFINRDKTERYAVAVSATSLRVFDIISGAERPVVAPAGLGYLAGVSGPEDLTMMTIADYSFVVNRKRVVQMDPASATPARPFEAVVDVKSGNYSRTYSVSVNGVTAASFTTPSGSTALDYPFVATTYIAETLYNQLVAALGNTGAPWGIGIHQNAIHITRYDSPFSISVSDGNAGNSMSLTVGKANKFSSLPNFGPDGYVVEVANSEGTNFDNMWVRADKGGTNANSQLLWKEIPKPGVVTEFLASTMPHILRREADGSFFFGPADWDPMVCGDGVITSPPPSFVGQTIRELFFHRNRLGIMSEESVALSRSGSFFNFWRTTTSALLDDDPIDVAASHIKVATLRHAVPFRDSLILFADQTQFRLAGNELLSPKTVSLRPLTEYSCASGVKPVSMGVSLFFASEASDGDAFASVMEWAYESKTDRTEDTDVTAHVPALIPGNLSFMVGSVSESMVFVRAAPTPNTLYAYRSYWANGERVQSAWVKWTFSGSVESAEAIESDLYLILRDEFETRIERLRLDPAEVDDGLTYALCLDSAQTRTSTGEFPTPGVTRLYAGLRRYLVDTTICVKAGPPSDTQRLGQTVKVLSSTVGYVDIEGEWPAGSVFIFGEPFVSTFDLSPVLQRDSNGAAVTGGRLQILSMELRLDRTSTFGVEIRNGPQPVAEETYRGTFLGSAALSSPAFQNLGRFAFTVSGRAETVRIRIVCNSYFPAAFIAATWKGLWTSALREA